MNNNTVTIVIATCDRPDRLVFALASIARAIEETGKDHRVIVVDNGTKLSARKVAEESKCHVDYIESEPYNKSVALNVGIDAAQTEWLAFTDDDALSDKGWLLEGERFAVESGFRVFGGKIDYCEEKGQLPRWLKAGRSGRVPVGPAIVKYEPMAASGKLGERPVPLGANIFVHKSVFEKYGQYSERLWTQCGAAALGCEDAEFSIRVRNAGEKIGYCAESVVLHPVYEGRATLLGHLKWSYHAGIRDVILFPHGVGPRFSSGFFMKFCLKTAFKSVCSIITGDIASGVCDLMDFAHVCGQRKRSFLSLNT